MSSVPAEDDPPQHSNEGTRAFSQWLKWTAGASSVAGALALSIAWPSLGTPILTALTVVMIWLQIRSK